MRQIKFRGRDIKTGKYVFGDFITPWADDQKYPRIRYTRDYYKNDVGHKVADCAYYDVEPESVAQLIGVDKNGNEIYETDKVIFVRRYRDRVAHELIDKKVGEPWAATFRDYSEILSGAVVLEEAA